jgi:hypothetical protein
MNNEEFINNSELNWNAGNNIRDNMKKNNNWIEVLEDEELKKIDAYLEWEQEYFIIHQSLLLEENVRSK